MNTPPWFFNYLQWRKFQVSFDVLWYAFSFITFSAVSKLSNTCRPNLDWACMLINSFIFSEWLDCFCRLGYQCSIPGGEFVAQFYWDLLPFWFLRRLSEARSKHRCRLYRILWHLFHDKFLTNDLNTNKHKCTFLNGLG